MVFYIQSSEGAGSGEQLGQITLPQFRGLMLAAKAITTRFPPEKVGRVALVGGGGMQPFS